MTYDLYNGMPPHVRDSDTSFAAALRMLPKAQSKRHQIVRFIRRRGELGATCDECEYVLEMPHTTASARIREAVLEGDLVDSGRRRQTRWGALARVYVAESVPAGDGVYDSPGGVFAVRNGVPHAD